MKYLYLIVGPSGSGKTTLVNNLKQKWPDIREIVSYTTRPARSQNESGHVFVTDEEFDALGPLCAYTEFDGHRYGVTSDQIDDGDIYVIDPPGVEYLKYHYKGGRRFKVLWLYVSPGHAASRMLLRGDSEKAVRSRLVNDDAVFCDPSVADKIIYTDFESSISVAKKAVDWIRKMEGKSNA